MWPLLRFGRRKRAGRISKCRGGFGRAGGDARLRPRHQALRCFAMGIDRAAVDYVARLARLALDDDERDRMRTELDDILGHAGRIQALDFDGVEPTLHPLPLLNAARPDEVTPSLSQSDALHSAPLAEDGRFRVPRIIEDA